MEEQVRVIAETQRSLMRLVLLSDDSTNLEERGYDGIPLEDVGPTDASLALARHAHHVHHRFRRHSRPSLKTTST